MLKTHKRACILSSIVILLPILFGILMWNKLPDSLITHWGADGQADGTGSKIFAVFIFPVLLLAGHWVGLLATSLDKKQKNQHPKALNLIFWIVPVLSLFLSGMVYATAFGWVFEAARCVPALLGLMFLVLGNYFPKIRRNRTLGIKLPWTMHNEENWNKTHRLGGKIWVVGGLILIFSVFLPAEAMVWVMVVDIIAMAVIPTVYSYALYRRHKAAGVVYAVPPMSRTEKTVTYLVTLVLVVLVVGICIVMLTGDIQVQATDTALEVRATYWADLTLPYDQIDTAQVRTNLDVGLRTNGFGSPRLSLGTFQNDEFGTYTLYARTGADTFLVLHCGEKTLVIALADSGETQVLYQTIQSHIS